MVVYKKKRIVLDENTSLKMYNEYMTTNKSGREVALKYDVTENTFFNIKKRIEAKEKDKIARAPVVPIKRTIKKDRMVDDYIDEMLKGRTNYDAKPNDGHASEVVRKKKVKVLSVMDAFPDLMNKLNKPTGSNNRK